LSQRDTITAFLAGKAFYVFLTTFVADMQQSKNACHSTVISTVKWQAQIRLP
jgi:hypothetical protein